MQVFIRQRGWAKANFGFRRRFGKRLWFWFWDRLNLRFRFRFRFGFRLRFRFRFGFGFRPVRSLRLRLRLERGGIDRGIEIERVELLYTVSW